MIYRDNHEYHNGFVHMLKDIRDRKVIWVRVFGVPVLPRARTRLERELADFGVELLDALKSA